MRNSIRQSSDKESENVNAHELLHKKGGQWLGSARSWMQRKFTNGEQVTWGSQDVLEGRTLTVQDIEHFAATIAAAAINEDRKKRND